jgi:biopolymer transport protein ExbD
MKMRYKSDTAKNELQMTSMIDVVFLLLVFFMLNFKVVEQEADFSIRMPLAAAGAGNPEENTELPLKLRMRANAGGELVGMQLNDIELGTDFAKLQQLAISLVGTPSGPVEEGKGPELEIDNDYNLRYAYVIEAISNVSGVRDPGSGQVARIVQRIKFAPPRKAG